MKKIALLEDDISLCRAIKEVIELKKYVCDVFYDGKVLHEIILEQIYDVYLLDIHVPFVDGLTLLRKITQMNLLAKVIIISADDSIESIETAYTHGCIDYLKKPFHLKELLIKIEKVLPQLPPLHQDVTLTRKEQALLEILVQQYPSIVSYNEIEMYVYETQEMSMDALRSLARRVRKKLMNASVVNYAGVGYKLEYG